MIGMVLAAGPGKRLAPMTDTLPKALLPIDDSRSILDLTLANLKSIGLDQVVVVTGHRADRIAERVAELERRHGVKLTLIFNSRAVEWNNAYSLWCARDAFGEGVLLVNGDTVHPRTVEQRILTARDDRLTLAVDTEKQMGDEEMKVRLTAQQRLVQITKEVDPTLAHGEYIGVALIGARIADGLADALEATWRQDSSLYYEDGFQEFADRGGWVETVAIGDVDWVEVDDHADLARARELACRY